MRIGVDSISLDKIVHFRNQKSYSSIFLYTVDKEKRTRPTLPWQNSTNIKEEEVFSLYGVIHEYVAKHTLAEVMKLPIKLLQGTRMSCVTCSQDKSFDVRWGHINSRNMLQRIPRAERQTQHKLEDMNVHIFIGYVIQSRRTFFLCSSYKFPQNWTLRVNE